MNKVGSKFSLMPRVLVIVAVLFFYFWTVTGAYYTFHLEHDHYNTLYQMLADGFKAGKPYLTMEPSQELLNLSDPYDPSLRGSIQRGTKSGAYNLHDVSMYKGKFYVYYGAVPALVLHLPYLLLTKRHVSEMLTVFIFSSGAFLFATVLLIYLRRKYFSSYIPEWMLIFCIALIGFTNVTPWLLRRPMMYEAAISGGLFFLTGALFLLCKAFENLKQNFWMLIIASLFLGLSIGCRPHYLFAAVILLILVSIILFKNKEVFSKNVIMAILVPVPFCICVLLLLAYNYVRFENVFEFGTSYQFSGVHPKSLKIVDPSVILLNLRQYLFAKPFINSDFPHIFIDMRRPADFPSNYLYGGVLGLIYNAPVCLVLVFGSTTFLIKKLIDCKNQNKQNFQNVKFPTNEFIIIFITFVAVFIYLLFITFFHWRYGADYTTSLLISSFIVWFYFDSLMINKLKLISRIVIVFISLISVVSHLAFSLSSESSLYGVNRKEFDRIKNFFHALKLDSISSQLNSGLKLFNSNNDTSLKVLVVRDSSKLTNNLQRGQLVFNELNGAISWFNGKYWVPVGNFNNQPESITSYGAVKMRIKFPTGVTVPQPLLVTGIPGAGNFIYVNYLPNNKIAFGHATWGMNGTVGNPISINPKQFYTLEISLGNLYPNISENKEFLDSVTISLDGKKVFYLNSSDELVKIRSKIHYFENRIKILETLLKDLNSSPEHYYYASQRLLGRIDADYNRSDFQFKVDDTLEITNPDVTSVSQALNKARAYRDELIVMDNELYPTNGHITVGRNEIGGNSCTPQFSGEIKDVQRDFKIL